jgi:hypothetical protein
LNSQGAWKKLKNDVLLDTQINHKSTLRESQLKIRQNFNLIPKHAKIEILLPLRNKPAKIENYYSVHKNRIINDKA